MVLGETPTTSAGSSDEEEVAEEEDESVESLASNLSVLGTLVDPTLTHHVEIRTDYCRAIVAVPEGGEGLPIICCRGPRCRTNGHSDARKTGNRAPPGYYLARISAEGRVLGGVPGARLTTEEMMENARVNRERDRLLISQAAIDQQNESVTFEDVIYDTPSEAFSAEESGEESGVFVDRKPAASSPMEVPQETSEARANRAMAEMAAQMNRMSLINKSLTDRLSDAPGALPAHNVAPTPVVTITPPKSTLHQRKYHAVAAGRVPGIYEDKEEVRKQVQGVPFTAWKSFKTYEGAQNYMLAFEAANQMRDRKDFFAAQEQDRAQPPSILRGPKQSPSIVSMGSSDRSEDMTCPTCQKDHLEADCPRRWTLASGRKKPPPKLYYAVAIGRKPGVYQSWGECHPQVNGYSGNLYQSFDTFEEAYNFFITHQAQDPGSLKGTGLPLAIPSQTGTGGDQVAGTSKRMQGRALGRDPSTGKESELFKIGVRSEGLLIESMTPDNLSPRARQALTDVAVDAVAQPGASRVTDNDDQTNTLTLSVATLANGSGGGSGRLGNVTDFLWKQERRTTMRYGIDSLEKLKTRIADLEDVGERVLKHLLMVTRDILVQEGWNEEEANDWATSSLVFRVSSDTLRNYIDLHQRVYSVGQADGWPMAKAEMEHHASKLAIRRSSAPSRIVCLCENYCYLRDAKKSSWRTLQLMESRERALAKRVEESLARAPAVAGSTSSLQVCKKCHSLLHPGGQMQCPFKNMSNTKAAEAMTKLMAGLYKMASSEE
jgi:hypothetical protein